MMKRIYIAVDTVGADLTIGKAFTVLVIQTGLAINLFN